MLYPSVEKAASLLGGEGVGVPAAAVTADMMGVTWGTWYKNHWSRKLECKVHLSEPNEVFMCLGQENTFVHVLFGEKQGWIIYKDWLKIERVL